MSVSAPQKNFKHSLPALLPTSTMATSFIFSHEASAVASRVSSKFRRNSQINTFWGTSTSSGKLFGHQGQLHPSPPVSPKRGVPLSKGPPSATTETTHLKQSGAPPASASTHPCENSSDWNSKQIPKRTTRPSSSCIHVSRPSELERWEMRYHHRAQSARGRGATHCDRGRSTGPADGCCGFVAGSALGANHGS